MVLQVTQIVRGYSLKRVLLLAALLPAMALAIDCANPEEPADRAICGHPELRKQNDEIESLTAGLKAKAIVQDTVTPFLRQRNNCSNETGDVAGCVQKVQSQRLAALRKGEEKELLGQAYFIDVPFLWKYWGDLEGRKLAVYGCLSLTDATPRVHAELESENQPVVQVLFKSMPEQTAEFLDDQRPCAHWVVTVRKEGGKLLLFADEVLGNRLP